MPSLTDVEVVGQILREARVTAGLTQDELSATSRLPQSRVSNLELGKITEPGARELVHLAQILEIDRDELLAPFEDAPSRKTQPQRRPRLAQVAS